MPFLCRSRKYGLHIYRRTGKSTWLKAGAAVVVEKMFGIYTGNRSYHFDGLDVLPVADFLKMLYAGEVFLSGRLSPIQPVLPVMS